MASFIHADIFFFVATIGVAVATLFMTIIGINVIKVIMNIRDISEKARLECELVVKEIGNFRQRVHNQSFGLRGIARMFRGFVYQNN